MSQITVLSGPERRRRWRAADKFRILEEAFAPGACVADVARQRDISTGLIYTWRRKAQAQLAGRGFVEAVVATVPAAGTEMPVAILVELPHGGRISISASSSPALVAAVLGALR